MKTLVTGSIAYDTIMVFEDKFKNHILPDQVHILNVCFFAPQMRREFGGCAGNIAYNLKLLGGEPVIMGAVGQDFKPYDDFLRKTGLSNEHIKWIDDSFTAQAFITTDIDNNQITAFHPGAMNQAHQNKVQDVADVELGIVAPDGRDAMLEHAAQFADLDIPFVFDPGQGLPMFSGEELLHFCKQASYAVMNDYESQMMQEKTGKNMAELAQYVKAFIVTNGGKGSTIYAGDEIIDIPVAAISESVDPTGCGDAYRAGLLFGLSKGLDWQTTGRIAALCGAIKIEVAGTLNHTFGKQEFEQRYHQSFGEALVL